MTDSDGRPIPGATVSIKARPDLGGALTDSKGHFQLSVPDNSTLIISFLGYNTEEVAVNPGSTSFRVTLSDATTAIDDVVVVGYGVQRKESVVGAISQVDNKALVNSGTTNITNALAGKLSGVTSIQSSGQPGENDATLLIRGVSSWNGSSPLVLVDGVERDFADLDPNEVETISVLKDASATAVFGAKGANGVIIVTTKVGDTGRPKMNLSVEYGLDIPTDVPDHISSYVTGQMYNVAMMNQGQFGNLYSQRELEEYRSPSSRINSLRYPDTDWFDLLMKKCASTVNANFNISGGSKRVKYFLSLGYTHEGSIIKKQSDYKNTTFQYDRINYRSNLDFKLTKSTSLAVKVGGTLGIKQMPDGNTANGSVSSLINMFYSASPMQYPAYFPDWALEEIPDWDYPDASGKRLVNSNDYGTYFRNPYTELNYPNFTQTTRNKLFTDVILKQDLGFITEGLSIQAKASLSSYFSRVSQKTEDEKIPTYRIDWDYYDSGLSNPWIDTSASLEVSTIKPYKVLQGGLQNTYYSTFYWEGSINYSRRFGRHSVTALVLFNQRENLKQTDWAYRTQGLVARVTYDFGHKYLLEANIGYTGSEQFSPKNRYGFFPSVAVGYVLSQERFWKQALPWWNKFKLRYSDGLVGSDQASGQRWLYYGVYDNATSSQNSMPMILESSAANETAKWETARKRDLGIELGWLDMITLGIDLFDERRRDMLVTTSKQTPLLVGGTFKPVNKGELKKHGLEIELGFRRKTRYGLTYDINGMVSLNENRIVYYADQPYQPDYQKIAGKPWGSQTSGVGLVDGGYYTSVDDIHNYPSYNSAWSGNVFPGSYKFLDYNADGKIDSNDQHPIDGTKYAPVIYSFGGGLNYKGFSFNVLFYGNSGKYVDFQRGFEYEFNGGDIRVHKAQMDYWRPDNPGASHAALTTSKAAFQWGKDGINASGDSDIALGGRTWRKADFLTVKEVYAAYTFNGKRLKSSVGIDRLSIYLTANNLWTFTDLIEGNPMATRFSSGFYPIMTTVKLGVKVGF